MPKRGLGRSATSLGSWWGRCSAKPGSVHWRERPLAHVLSLGLRLRPVRWLMARFRWPRAVHVSKMSHADFEGYVRSIGAQAEAEAALAEYRGAAHQRETISEVRSQEGSADRRPGAAVP